MANNQEIEVRAILTAAQRRTLPKKLRAGSKGGNRETRLSDIYYCPKKTGSFRQIEMQKPGSYSLRLRESREGNKSRTSLNVKIITSRGDHNSWRELEIAVSSLAESEKILAALGFKPFFRLEKTRRTFHMRGVTVAVEDIKNFGPVIEAEIITSRKRETAAKQKILNLSTDLEIKKEQIVKKSVTNLLMRKMSRF